MTRRAPAEIYAAARAAGLISPAAVIATAIGLAESGGDDTELGDTNLEDATWGPSVGVWQIRTDKSQTGTGGDRDISALQGNLTRQAQAMAHISAGGANWSPWTAYTTGSFRQFLDTAQSVPAAAGGGTATPVGDWWWPYLTPLPEPSTGSVEQLLAPGRDLLLKAAVVALGLGLVGLGLLQVARPKIARSTGELSREADQAASVAAVAA